MNSKKLPAYLCAAILIFFMVSIFTRAITKNIVFDKFGINNRIVQAIFFDNKSALNTTTSSTSVSINWSALYPFEDSSDNISEDTSADTDVFSVLTAKIDNLSAKIEGKVNYYMKEKLIGYELWVYCHMAYQRLLNWDYGYIGNTTDNGIITMSNGYLTYSQQAISDDDLSYITDSISDLNDFLEETDIPFYYINAGSKVDPDDKQLSYLAEANEYTNENADRLLENLSSQGVTTVDMRKMMKEDNLDWYESYYATDAHWTTRVGGLWCASKIAGILNENNDFNYDASLFSTNSYKITKYDDFWYGQIATATKHPSWYKKDSFEVFSPLFSTSFHLTIPSKGYDKTGSFNDALFDEDLLDDIKEYCDTDFLYFKGAYYYSVRDNSALSTIINNDPVCNSGKKILMICDSFSWYTSAFLALGTSEIDCINPYNFTGSIREYINQTQPDVVIMMMCSRSIRETSNFDLR